MAKTITLPSSEADQKAIFAVIRELSGSMTRIEGEKSYIKEAIADMSKKYELTKKYLAKTLKTYHKQTFAKEVTEGEDFQEFYESLTGETVRPE